MTLDRFEVRVGPAAFVRWPEGGGFQPVELRVNGVGLIDMVREVERPYAELEYAEHVVDREQAEAIGPRDAQAGRYLYLPACHVFLPSRNLLGEPYPHGFAVEPDRPSNGKSLLLGCTCSVIECWFLLARITVAADTVTWSDFCQFHREWWRYDIAPFVFDRRQYEAQLAPPDSTDVEPRNPWGR